MRGLRSLLGVAIILAVMGLGGPLRLMLVPLLLALLGLAFALIWFNRRESSNWRRMSTGM